MTVDHSISIINTVALNEFYLNFLGLGFISFMVCPTMVCQTWIIAMILCVVSMKLRTCICLKAFSKLDFPVFV